MRTRSCPLAVQIHGLPQHGASSDRDVQRRAMWHQNASRPLSSCNRAVSALLIRISFVCPTFDVTGPAKPMGVISGHKVRLFSYQPFFDHAPVDTRQVTIQPLVHLLYLSCFSCCPATYRHTRFPRKHKFGTSITRGSPSSADRYARFLRSSRFRFLWHSNLCYSTTRLIWRA